MCIGMICFLGCDQGGYPAAPDNFNGTLIQGKIANGENLKAFFDKILLNNTTTIMGSAEIDKNGVFSIPVNNAELAIYRLRIGAKSTTIALSGKEKVVTIEGDLQTLQNGDYTLTGTKEGQIFKAFEARAKASGNQIPEAEARAFADTTSSLISSLFATVKWINIEKNMDYHKGILAKFKATNPGSTYARDYENIIKQIENKLASQNLVPGKPALDIDLPNPDGKNMKLSDLKGKIVLVDFWASWCKPCRMNNPHVVEMYKKYKSKGFTVYSVSLDKANQKNRWIQAIKDDNLTWPYHVSDLKGWQCVPAKQYGVRGIPYTVLIDQEGNIAALNPRANTLEQEIKKLL